MTEKTESLVKTEISEVAICEEQVLLSPSGNQETESPCVITERLEISEKDSNAISNSNQYFISPWTAILFALVSSCLLAFNGLLVKLTERIHILEMVLFRQAVMLMFISPMALCQHHSFVTPRMTILFLIIRSLAGITTVLLVYYSISLIPLSDAVAISFTSPIFVHLGACIFLKEHCGPFDVLIILLTIGGAILVAQPTFLFSSQLLNLEFKSQMLGTMSAVASSITASIVYLTIRKIRHLQGTVIITYYSVIGAFITLILCISLGYLHDPILKRDIVISLGLGLIASVSQLLFVKAAAFSNAGPISLCRGAELVLSFILQVVILGHKPNVFSIAGSAVILISTSSLLLKQWTQQKKPNAPWLKRIFCLHY